MKQHQSEIAIRPAGRGMTDITHEAQARVRESGVETGMAHLFVRHTSCSLLIQENADPDVRGDLERFLSRLAPDGDPIFRHVAEGPDDMPAHVRAALTAVSLSVPVRHGRLALGTWQGIYLYEHRLHPSRRTILVHVAGC